MIVRGTWSRTQHSFCSVSAAARTTKALVHRRVHRPHRQFVCPSAEVQQQQQQDSVRHTSKGKSRKSAKQQPSNGSQSSKSSGSLAAKTSKGNDVVLYYCTGWPQAKLHCSVNAGPWQDTDFAQVNSSNGKWCVARMQLNSVAIQTKVDQPLVEFVVHNGAGVYDKPQTGGNYEISEAGVFALRDGSLHKSSGEAVLLVSDLDDTMIGDDTATAEFRDYWESEALTRGSLLVYNTGRAVDKFQELCQQKQHCLAMPDMLMSSVGTKVYNWQNGSWVEDAQYASRLDHAWKLDTVREATYAALAAAGREKMHFRPPEEQNDHKVTCGVHIDVVEQVQQQISNSLGADGVKARLILSGTGDWRFLDIVSINAGKLQALEFVRHKYGFAHNRTIACGDSGNDKDMLSGQNLAIVVGNAQPDLLKWVNDTQLSPDGADARLVITEQHMARGILEGLHTFGLK
ncbi:hypothetical protein ABBQ32_009336 [Trebouxia sp. C0010 RCD-2024]